MKTLYLVRHGESESNAQGLVATRALNEPLTPRGLLQSEQTAQALAGLTIQALYCSPLRRARQTAAVIGARLGLRPVPMDEFCEMDMGPLEGQPLDEAARDVFRWLNREWSRGVVDAAFAGGETYRSVWARMRSGVAKVLAPPAHTGIVVVGHGGLFSTTLASLAPSAEVALLRQRENLNCSVSELQMELRCAEWVGTVVRWADTTHLNGEAGNLVVQRIPGL